MRRFTREIVAVLLCIALGFAGFQWYVGRRLPGGMRTYVEMEHKSWIQKQFKENWYLLISSPDYDVNYMLDNHAPNKYEPKLKNKMDIIVEHDDQNNPVGFVTYYMRSQFQGEVLFLTVAKETRGKGYARQLMNHAEQDLKQKGAQVIKLVTRTSNTPAQGLYTSLGYEETGRDKEFVFYRKIL